MENLSATGCKLKAMSKTQQQKPFIITTIRLI